MSFKCELCGKVQPPRTQPVKKIVERRERVYPEIRDEHDPTVIIASEGHGWEVVREVNACRKCANG